MESHQRHRPRLGVIILDDEVGQFVERRLPILAATERDPMVFPGRFGIEARDRPLGVMMQTDLIQDDALGLGHALGECEHGRPSANRRVGLIIGNNNTNHGGIVCGDPVSNADDHPPVRGVSSTRSPITESGRATATPGPSCPVRFGSGSHGARCVACLGFHSTSITSPPALWAVWITRPTFGPCARRATTGTGRPVVRRGRGSQVRGVPTATSNPLARVRVGGLFGFGGPNRFGGGLTSGNACSTISTDRGCPP